MNLLTNIEEMVKHIPKEAKVSLHKTLADIILKSKNAQMLPPDLAKKMLNLYHDDKLGSDEGFSILLKAAIELEKEKVSENLKETNLGKAASYLGDD